MSNIVLKRLEFSNMFSYGDNNVINLNANPISQLDGENGVGKSTIALIIQELLFSSNIKSIKKSDILNRYNGAKTWNGVLHFSADSDEYTIEVSRTGAASKVKLLKNNEDISEHKIPDTYRKLNNIFGKDFKVFSQLTYQSSTDLLEFLKATDANRKKFLISLFNLEKYLERGDSIRLLLGSSTDTLNKLQGELTSIEDFLKNTQIPEIQEEKEVPDNVDPKIIQRIGELNTELANINETCKAIDKNNLRKKELNSLVFDIGLKEPDKFEQTEVLQALKHDIPSLRRIIADKKQEISVLSLATTCRTCGQPIDNSHQLSIKNTLETQIAEYEAELNKAQVEYKELNKEFELYSERALNFNKNQQNITKFEQLSQLIDNSLPTTYPDFNKLQTEKQELEGLSDKINKNIKEVINFNKNVSAHNAKVAALIEQNDKFLTRQVAVKQDIININEEISALTILKKAFSPTGIVAFKLENLTKELEITINYYLSILSDGQFQVEFSLEKEKLNILVINDGVVSPIETASGGEYSRIQTAILLAIRKLLSKIHNSNINLLFLDEITGVLDSAGKEKLIEVLSAEENLNVFLISHEFSHPLINKLYVSKDDNKISTIQ